LSSDERTAVLVRDRDDGLNYLDIVIVRRQETSQPFGPPEPIANVNSTADEVGVSLAADGSSLYLESNRTGTYRIHFARRPSASGLFSSPTPVDVMLGSTFADGGPYVTPSGDGLYFHAFTSLTSDLFRGTRVTDVQFDVTLLAALNSTFNDAYPVVSPDERTIYFSSTRMDGGARGGEDIWMATRASTEDHFAGPSNLATLNTAADERPSWISEDGCRLYFDRGGSAGGPATEIYVAERTR
jgi:hypothetical protein